MSNQGMSRDLIISKVSENTDNGASTFAYENHNIRITTTNDSTLLAVTNEKGPYQGDVETMNGKYLGHCIIGKYLIVFTHCESTVAEEAGDYIYKIEIVPQEEGSNISCIPIFKGGNLNFEYDHPIETIGWYESEDIQKVYWVDGKNPTRFINIVSSEEFDIDDSYQFDFTAHIDNIPTVSIEKDYSLSGLFMAGTIQYFLTLYNKYGAETGVVWQSSVQYIDSENKGLAPNETAGLGFRFKVSDTGNYKYCRLYSAYRNTENSPIEVKLVYDSLVTDTIIDTNYNTATVDSNLIYYLGGQPFTASTIAEKDGTLFLGDIETSNIKINDDLKEYFEDNRSNTIVTKTEDGGIMSSSLISFGYKELNSPEIKSTYSHIQQINESQSIIATFKYGEVYRFGIQFMTNQGAWTSVLWVGDNYCSCSPSINEDNSKYLVANATFKFEEELSQIITNYNFVSYRLMVAETTPATRRIMAQGVVNPTLFNYRERYYNEPHSIPSWNFRPRGSEIPYLHLQNIGNQYKQYSELQGVTNEVLPLSSINDVDTTSGYTYYSLYLGIDQGQELTAKLVFYKFPHDWVKEDIEEWCKGNNSLPSNCYKEFNVYINTASWDKTSNKLYDTFKSKIEKESDPNLFIPFFKNELPDKKLYKAVNTWKNKAAIISGIVGGIVAAVGAIATAVSFGAAAAPTALAVVAVSEVLSEIFSSTLTVAAVNIITAACVTGVAGIAAAATYVDECKDEAPKNMASKGYIPIEGELEDVEEALSKSFQDITPFSKGTKSKIPNCSVWLAGGRINNKPTEELNADYYRNQFYIDNSIVTLNSPELENNYDLFKNNSGLGFRIRGYIPIQAVTTDNYLDVSQGWAVNSGTLNGNNLNAEIFSSNIEGLTNDYLYQDCMPSDPTVTSANASSALSRYKVYLWHRNSSLTFGNINNLQLKDSNGVNLQYSPAKVNKKLFSNLRYSYNTIYKYKDSYSHYINVQWEPINGNSEIKICDSNSNALVSFDINNNKYLYQTDYNNQLTFINDNSIDTGYPIVTENNFEINKGINTGWDTLKAYDPIRISYKETPHLLIPFNDYNNYSVILPKTGNELEDGLSLYSEYDSTTQYKNFNKTFELPATINLGYILIDGLNGICSLDARDLTPASYSPTKVLLEGQPFTNFCNICFDNSDAYRAFLEDIDITTIFIRVVSSTNSDEIMTYYIYRITNASGTLLELEQITENSDYNIKNSIFGSIKYYSKGGGKERNKEYFKIIDYYSINSTCIEHYSLNYNVINNLLTFNSNYPYLYLGEVYKKNFNYPDVYKSDEASLSNINWLICSNNYNIGEDVDLTWGDTYYQRWDCLKTYPYSEDAVNSVVDILSFMVETHINLDGRYDNNRGTHNILNARPSTWNLINRAYTQNNNVLTYKTFEKDVEERNKFENQIVWSQNKLNTSNVDNWTGINLISSMNLNGSLGKITKLLNVNDSLFAFQDKGISVINYNNNTALTTTTGVSLEMAKTGKVNGYSKLSDTIGCHNKWSIVNSAAGVFFIDDYNKKLFLLTKEGLTDVSSPAYFNKWFEDNISKEVWNPNSENKAFKLSEDSATGDIYITNSETCLVYNYKLKSFVSFMSYENCPLFINFLGDSLVLHLSGDYTGAHEMFKGEYNKFFTDEYKPYSMEFRLNPSPMTDNVFTNVTYIADCIDPSKDLKDISPDNISLFDSEDEDRVYKSFDTITAYNEYQKGELPLETSSWDIKHLKKKFRIWRSDIPRDGDTVEKHGFAMDRMRNPWIHLKLANNSPDNSKMIFHNMSVTYYK